MFSFKSEELLKVRCTHANVYFQKPFLPTCISWSLLWQGVRLSQLVLCLNN